MKRLNKKWIILVFIILLIALSFVLPVMRFEGIVQPKEAADSGLCLGANFPKPNKTTFYVHKGEYGEFKHIEDSLSPDTHCGDNVTLKLYL